MLRKGVTAAVDLESAIAKLSRQDDDRLLKCKSLIYILHMKHTELKMTIMTGELSAEKVVSMKPEDFMSEQKRKEMEAAQEDKMAAQRTDWAF